MKQREYKFNLTTKQFNMIMYCISAEGLAAGGANKFYEKYYKVFNPEVFDIHEFDKLFFKLLSESSGLKEEIECQFRCGDGTGKKPKEHVFGCHFY